MVERDVEGMVEEIVRRVMASGDIVKEERGGAARRAGDFTVVGLASSVGVGGGICVTSGSSSDGDGGSASLVAGLSLACSGCVLALG